MDKAALRVHTEHDPADAVFLKNIGKRVREARSRASITRKALAQRSGVSERYLADLESGLGNVIGARAAAGQFRIEFVRRRSATRPQR